MVIVGCGGSDGGIVAPPPVDEPSVNTSLFFSGPVPKPGLLQVTYDTGQGRAGGDPLFTANLRRLVIEDDIYGFGHPDNVVRTLLNPERVLGLDQYTSQTIDLNAPMTGFSINMNRRVFDQFNLELETVTFDDVPYSGTPGQSLFNIPFNMTCSLMPGRTSSITVFLNDAMFAPDGFGGLTFLNADFEVLNYDPIDLEMKAHLSDYLAFDISGIANPPLMTSGGPATAVYFSGDAIGLSDTPTGVPTLFEVLVPESPDPGSFEGFCALAPSFPPNSPNTYTLRQIDPRSLPGTAFITALQGTWKWWVNPNQASQSPILNSGNFVFLTFPQTSDDGRQDCVMIALAGGQITEFYFGEIDLNTDSFVAWPIFEVTEGTTNDEISGSLGSYVLRPGGAGGQRDVRSGAFNIDSGVIPVGFPTIGKFIVYRL